MVDEYEFGLIEDEGFSLTDEEQLRIMPIPNQLSHVDDWIDDPTLPSEENYKNICYAKFVLNWMRMPAHIMSSVEPWMKQHKLYCKYKNKTYKVTGASRLGDILLASNLGRTNGYDIRVSVLDCSGWTDSV